MGDTWLPEIVIFYERNTFCQVLHLFLQRIWHAAARWAQCSPLARWAAPGIDQTLAAQPWTELQVEGSPPGGM